MCFMCMCFWQPMCAQVVCLSVLRYRRGSSLYPISDCLSLDDLYAPRFSPAGWQQIPSRNKHTCVLAHMHSRASTGAVTGVICSSFLMWKERIPSEEEKSRSLPAKCEIVEKPLETNVSTYKGICHWGWEWIIALGKVVESEPNFLYLSKSNYHFGSDLL